MRPTARLNAVGQSLWLDTITRSLLDSGELGRIIRGLDVTGLTSNPTIFDKAVSGSQEYDAEIRALAAKGHDRERIFFRLAIADLVRAADLFRDVHRRSAGVDGWVSLEVSPTLAADTEGTVAQARALHAEADRPNLFIKVPGTPEGLPAIERLTAAGVPVNVTLLFSTAQYLAAAEAWMRGLERRVKEGKAADVCSVASLFISRWDRATPDLPEGLRNRLGLAIGEATYAAYLDLISGERFLALAEKGARPQRLLYASTGTKDPTLSADAYVTGLASPNTVNTMPEETLRAFAKGGRLTRLVPPDGVAARETLVRIAAAGVDLDALAAKLQKDGADAFVASWNSLMSSIDRKSAALAGAGA
jgi:transaldolase